MHFNPRSPRGLRPWKHARKTGTMIFQSTQPKRAATARRNILKLKRRFQSTQPKRAATTAIGQIQAKAKVFQSTQPKRAATHIGPCCGYFTDISIHAAQEGCDKFCLLLLQPVGISIHAAQEGCDEDFLEKSNALCISIHAAQEGCDLVGGQRNSPLSIFQSTQPKRAATKRMPDVYCLEPYFNPRSPRGLRPERMRRRA